MRHKQQPIGDFGRPLVHGVTRYKKYGCRCAVCREAMSAYGKSRYIPTVLRHDEPRTVTTCSWWVEAPSDGFTAFVEREQSPRMRLSRFASIQGKPYTTDEVSR